MCGPKFCSMKISQEVREFARLQNQEADAFIAANPPSPSRGEGQLAAGKQGEGATGLRGYGGGYGGYGDTLLNPQTPVTAPSDGDTQ